MKLFFEAEHFNYISESGYRLIRLANVFEINHSRPTTEIITSDGAEVQNSAAYFVIDNDCHAAFAHFVYESALHLKAFHDLVKIHPQLKVVLKESRSYKNLFLDFFNIPLDRVVYKIEKYQNVCYLLPNINLHQQSRSEYFETLLNSYIEMVDKVISCQNFPILYLPRQSKENYSPNDRRFVNTSEIKHFIEQKGGEILNTDIVSNLHSQISQIKAAQRILLDYGSSFFVNGLFAKDSTLTVIGNLRQHLDYPIMGTIHEMIIRRNKVLFLDWISVEAHSEISFDVSRLKSEIEHTFKPIPERKRKITVIGDSHSAIFRQLGMEPKYDLHVETMNSVTMHRIGRDSEISRMYAESKVSIGSSDLLFSLFGEVDVRANVQKQINAGRNVSEIIETLATNYCEDLSRVKKMHRGIIICLLGIVPPIAFYSKQNLYSNVIYDGHPFPFRGSDLERLEWTRLLNDRLFMEATERGFIFLDLCCLYEDSDGYLPYELSDTNVHIGDPTLLKQAVWHIINHIEEVQWSQC